jgi:mannose-6-phosphate isomerase-like protein (cupin superfamily)
MLRDNPEGSSSRWLSSAGGPSPALHVDGRKSSDDRPSCLENPRPAGAESTLTENASSPFHAEPRQKHLLLFTEEVPPGAVIPKHKHHAEDEILLIQTGSAHVWLGDKEYDAQPGALVFIPAETWISLKNTGKENISLVAIWNEPGFGEMLLCGSVPKGQVGELISRDGVKNCYHHRDAELETVQPLADKKP